MSVCEKCVAGTPFAAFVAEHGKTGACSFCNDAQKGCRVVSLADLLDEIENIVRGEYTEDVGEYDVRYSDDDGNDEYEPVVNTLDSFVLLEVIGLGAISGELFDCIREHFSTSDWISHDPMAPTDDQVNSYGWSRFKEDIKTSLLVEVLQHHDPGKSEYDPEHIHIAHVPGMLMETVRPHLVKLPKKETKVWRVQVFDEGEEFLVPERFTAPPPDKARQPNRMSPPGVSVFYGAEEYNTAVEETVDGGILQGKVVWGLAFETTRDSWILDLTTVYGRPHHEFLKRHRKLLSEDFLLEYAQDVSKPILRDGTEHAEYRPTQAFTEFIRTKMRGEDDEPVYGIKYTSSKTGLPCYVIFADQEQCLDGQSNEEKQQLLRGIPDSLKKCEVATMDDANRGEVR